MKLLVFRSTGGTGRALVEQALAEGHEVTAYARNPAKLDDMAHPRLQVIRGDVLDPVAVEKSRVRRLVCQSFLGVGDGRANLGFLAKYMIVPVFLRRAFADHERKEAFV